MTPPAPRLLYLVRHRQATGQAPDAPLTPQGTARAALLAPLDIDHILSSPFLRARGSATSLAARLGIPIETDDRTGRATRDDARQRPARATVVATHGNLLALLLRHLDGRTGFAAWETLTSSDIYRVTLAEPPEPILRTWALIE